jgi:hypothetical protein
MSSLLVMAANIRESPRNQLKKKKKMRLKKEISFSLSPKSSKNFWTVPSRDEIPPEGGCHEVTGG